MIDDIRRKEGAALLTAFAATGEARTACSDIGITTSRTNEIVDLTDEVRAAVAEAGIDAGIALISTPHTTCAVVVNENEPGFFADLENTLETFAPSNAHYAHNEAPHAEEFEAPNGYAHVRAALLSSPSVLLPIREGELALGRWQRVFLIELDRGRPRSVQVTLLGRAV